ncbi:MAG TPA: amidase [Roseiflexaceae bacterium]|nr:amidase [Roseiflexaceae bacterium]
MHNDELWYASAVNLQQMLRSKQISAVELLAACEARIAQLNPQVNAIVTLTLETAYEQAQAADAALARGVPPGALHGLPIAHKDLVPTRGIRTTFGSPIYRDFVPDRDALIIERMRAAGAITIGKTNTPEFGAGSQTFNTLFGATRNPYDPTKTCGGSSGGAAVALACGMIPLADGSDSGGSLRNPAAFCNVVGLRPAPGRVAEISDRAAWQTLSVEGPMARNVEDAALLLSVLAGPDPRAPIAIRESGAQFAAPLERDMRGTRIAWCPDLGGSFPLDPQIAAVLATRRATFAALGCDIADTAPDFSGADEAFKILRAMGFELGYGELLDHHRDQIKDTVIWNVEQGRALTGPQIGRAERLRTALYHRVREFMEQYEFLVLAVTQVPPFDIQQPYITEIAGTPMETYIDWMRSCYYISITGLPAISVPAGFTAEGLPVGIQIVGRHQNELGVLQLAYAFQQATGIGRQRPPLG